MAALIVFGDRIKIGKESCNDGIMQTYSYKELTPELISGIVRNEKIKYIQISHNLPMEAFLSIDNVLAQRPDITFRIYGFDNQKSFDLNILGSMRHIQRLRLELSISDTFDLLHCEALCSIGTLKSLFLGVFDLKDYSFIKGLPNELEELGILAETRRGSIIFDCEWLLKFQKLSDLYLGKMAKKNITSISGLFALKDLILRGISLPDFHFLREKELESLSISWCKMNDLSSLNGFHSLKCLELWRVLKLQDISFISTLINLEILKLQDLRHIQSLPDLSELKSLKKIILTNMKIDESTISERLKPFILHW